MIHIQDIIEWDSGGDIILTAVVLKSGHVLSISEDTVVLHNTLDEAISGESTGVATIWLEAADN